MAVENIPQCFTDGEGNPIHGSTGPLPCPFCGATDSASVSHEAEAGDGLPAVYVATCADCGTQSPAGETELEAAARWNQRRHALPVAA